MTKIRETKEELKQKLFEQNQELEAAGLRKRPPSNLMEEIEEIENSYRDQIFSVAKACEEETGRPLSFYPPKTITGHITDNLSTGHIADNLSNYPIFRISS